MSSFGTLFKVTTYGESHCKSVGCIVENCPPGMSFIYCLTSGMQLTEADVQVQLSRRRPGQSALTTPVFPIVPPLTQRDEKDRVQIQSGTEFNTTLGTPIGMLVQNLDQRPHDYSEMDLYPRPSHADWTYLQKYGVKASSGGGRSSARETIGTSPSWYLIPGRVAAGAIAEKYLKLAHNIEIVAFVSSVGKIHMPTSSSSNGVSDADDDESPITSDYLKLLQTISREQIDGDSTRCPDAETAKKMTARIIEAKTNNDSIGGTVTCVIRGVPAGLGEPCFDKLEAKLAHAMLSIPATKGFEIGSGFASAEIPASKHNDPYVRREDGTYGTLTNNSGGIQGGISNGENIFFKIAFKSPATISQPQTTATYDGQTGVLAAKGRHDPCVVPRAVPIVETMAALVIMEYIPVGQADLVRF
jgi:chorismate synthase